MTRLPDGSVWNQDGDWVVDPEVAAPRLGLSPEDFRRALKDGRVTGTVERGEGEDAGRTRLTFRTEQRAWSIRIEPDGTAFETAPPVRSGSVKDWVRGQGSLH